MGINEDRLRRAVHTGARTVSVVVLQDATLMSAPKPPACQNNRKHEDECRRLVCCMSMLQAECHADAHAASLSS
eukprot:1160498-Pelagomonas_calceolata.AAC.8